jgi:hypothetical protein
MEQEYKRAGIEPPLEDLFNDRIAHLIMRRDGITLAEVWWLVETVRARMVAGAQHGAEPQAPSTVEPGPDCTPGAYAGSSAG